jgi:organic radical activating enzyme
VWSPSEGAVIEIDIVETFDSIQGEGKWTGTPMFFIRFAGCNLSCPWCDTDHSSQERVDVGSLVLRALSTGRLRVCITGGEPTHQPEGLAALVKELWSAGFIVHVETNGTGEIPPDVDWTTVSPKRRTLVVCQCCEEVKVVVQIGDELPGFSALPRSAHYYVQPEVSQGQEGIAWAVGLVMKDKTALRWALSLQMHKMINLR